MSNSGISRKLCRLLELRRRAYFEIGKRSLQIYIPEKYRSWPETNLTESYIHVASDIPYLFSTLGRLLDHQAETIGDRLGFVLPFQGVRKTYSQLNQDATKQACAFLALGLEPGDRVGMWGPNSYEWIVTMFAASKAGLILVNVNPAYKVHELEYCLNKVQMKAIVAAEGVAALKYYEQFQQLCPDLAKAARGDKVDSKRIPHLKHIIMLTKKPEKFPGTIAYSEFVESHQKDNVAQVEKITKAVQPDDPFNIQFTSGTTGSPKGATLSQFGLMNAAYFSGHRFKAGTESLSVVCPLPLYHVFGCVGNLVLSTIFGTKIVFPAEKFDPEATLKAIQDEKAQSISGVPTMFTDMLHHPNFSMYDLSSLKYGVMGGAPCPPELVKEVSSKMGIKNFTCGYGSTEQSLSTYIGFLDDPPEVFTVTTGYPLDHVESKLVDSDGKIVALGEKGELWTRGFGTMLGYWGDEAKTRENIRPDRWMTSGDIGTMNAQGRLKIVGRVKDMVIRGGENVYPTEIENVLHECDLVNDVHVCGVPDQRMGEEICAWVRVSNDYTAQDIKKTEQDLITFCQSQLAKYKIPKYFVFYREKDDIPMTVTGKVQKYKLSELTVKKLKLGVAQ